MNPEEKKNFIKKRWIIHLDMDAFYASVEQVDNPACRGQPVIVGGSSNRGVVSAASYEARTFGVRSAMPIVTARRLCPGGIFLPVRMERYKEVSRMVMDIFLSYTPLVEPLSLDEAFLDVTDSRALFGSAEEIARDIKKKIFSGTGLTVSAGVAGSKMVAKIASDIHKPDGLTIVPHGLEREFLAPLSIGRLWGVGKQARQTLHQLNVGTIGDLSRLPLEILRSTFGKHGVQLHYAAMAMDDREVVPEREIKSVGHEETFDKDISELPELERKLLRLTVRVGRRLRRYGLRGKTVTLKVKYHDFEQITRSVTLAAPTNDRRRIFQFGAALLRKAGIVIKPVRLIGLSVSQLVPATSLRQLSLFSPSGGEEKVDGLNQALDRIADRFGGRAILPARLLEGEEEEGG